MSLVSLENAGRQFRTEPLWEHLNLSIEPGDRLGIIGANGCGKSSLLRVLAGIDQPDMGTCYIEPGLNCSFLAQIPDLELSLTVKEALRKPQIKVRELFREYDQACQDLSVDNSPENSRRVSQLSAQLEVAGAWNLEAEMADLLSQLQLTDTDCRLSQLSVGQRKRLAVAAALLLHPQVLFLDEPTNHLDAQAVDWLEARLRTFKGSVVVVTHDRYFLDKTVHRIAEISRGVVTIYQGSYADYLEKKAQETELEEAGREKRENLLRRELDWFKRGARARSTKQKARQQRLALLLEDKPKSPEQVLSLNSLCGFTRLGSKGIILHDISLAFGERHLLDNYSLTLKKGDRLGLVGANGSGKSSLLKIFSELLAPNSGYLEVGTTVKMGFYRQEFADMVASLTSEISAIDYVRQVGDYIISPNGKQISAEVLMENFLFPRRQQSMSLSRLSGGEKKRLALLRVLMTSPNVLLLDEPTNDLDIPTLIRLEAWLDDFSGILVVVSHDRYFLDRTVDKLFYLGRGNPQEFKGDYLALREYLQKDSSSTPVKSTKPSNQESKRSPQSEKRAAKLSFKEKRELTELERDMEQGESRLAELKELLAQPSSDSQLIAQAYLESESLQVQLDKMMERWEELASIEN